ncbi:hypothetical protein B0A49_04794 [Cryomyces minteri]|uniref:Uncharacterized protein n=1 Tax=Cryomyces minteri TaxID=331657 RepID=A0A4U0X5R1_9PEZI|nr:hypothetical protein B0A49_04794 [Cryomyces minteri]
MNTIRSVGLGWGALIVAGGGAYYFAKRSINADRAERAETEERRRQMSRRLDYSAPPPQRNSKTREAVDGGSGGNGHVDGDFANTPSQEAGADPAPTRHAPENGEQRTREKSKYEAEQPFRARKGDRFS